MTKHTLSAQPRSITGRKVKTLRTQGLVPANVFGTDIKSASLQIKDIDFAKTFKEVGESTLVYLQIEGDKEPRPVMIHEVTRDPVSGHTLHVDFHQVNLKEKVTANVPVDLVGESVAQKDGLGILVQPSSELEIEALPTDMPQHLEVEVSGLAAVGDAILARDIKLASALTLKSDLETVVAKIEPLAKEEVVEAPIPAEGEVAPAEGAPVEEETAPSSTEEEKKAE